MAEQAEGELDEVVTGTGPLQQGAEQHEQEHEAGGDPEGDAEHPLSGDPLVVRQGGETHPAVRQQPRHPGAGQAVGEKHQGDHRQGRAQGAAGRLQQQRYADAGGDQIGGGEVAGALGQGLIHDEQIGGGTGGNQAEGNIAERHPVSGGAPEGREHQIGQQQGEGEVNGAGFGVIEDAKSQHEGQRRGDPELEQGPGQRQPGDQPAHEAERQPGAHVLGDQFLGRELFFLHRVNFCLRVQRHDTRCRCGGRVSKRTMEGRQAFNQSQPRSL